MAPARVVFGDLPAFEKERMLAFLVANEVEFLPDSSGRWHKATVKVVRQEEAKSGLHQNSTSSLGQRSRLRGGEQATTGSLTATRENGNGGPNGALDDYNPAKSANLLSVAMEYAKRYTRFTRLLPSLVQAPKLMLKAELINFCEEVYTARYTQDTQQLQQVVSAEAGSDQPKKKKKPSAGPASFPQSVLTYASKKFGLKQIVGQTCWNVARSVETHRLQHEGVELFGRFLEESYDALDLLFYLHIRNSAKQVISPGGTWCRAWRAPVGQAFHPQHRSVRGGGAATTLPEAAQSPAGCSIRTNLSVKQAMTVVKEVIDQDTLKATIFTCLKEAFEKGGQTDGELSLDWDHFLMICTEEFHKARGTEGLPARLATADAEDSIVAEFQKLVHRRWGMSVAEAFAEFDKNGSGVITHDKFVELVTDDLGYSGDVEDLWRLIDKPGAGFVGLQEWKALTVQLQREVGDDATEDDEVPMLPAGWDRNMSPEAQAAVLDESAEVAERLTASLMARGESDVKAEEVEVWALQVVLKKRGGKGRTKPSAKQAGSNYNLSIEDLQQAWEGFKLEKDRAKSPSAKDHAAPHLLPTPKGLKAGLLAASGAPVEDWAELGENDGADVPIDDLETSVRQLLSSATEELVLQAIATNAGASEEIEDTMSSWLKEALLEEFLPVTDALMESLVTGNLEAWLEHLAITPPGSSQQQEHFEALRSDFQDALATDINQDVVRRVCQATVSAAELRTLVCDRTGDLLVERRQQLEKATVVTKQKEELKVASASQEGQEEEKVDAEDIPSSSRTSSKKADRPADGRKEGQAEAAEAFAEAPAAAAEAPAKAAEAPAEATVAPAEAAEAPAAAAEAPAEAADAPAEAAKADV